MTSLVHIVLLAALFGAQPGEKPTTAQTEPAAPKAKANAQRPAQTNTGTAIRPFHAHIPETQVADLRRRALATRWPDKEIVPDQSTGVPLARLQRLVRYWGTGYDWR